MADSTATDELVRQFHRHGLNRVAVLDCFDLDASLRNTLLELSGPFPDLARVVVVGNAGDGFWRHIDADASADPVDTYSRSVTQKIIDSHLSGWNNRLLYPGDAAIPLQKIGAACGWARPSRLGISIDPGVGTWFAFRCVFVTSCPLPADAPASCPDVCSSCDAPCVQQCPVSAPGAIGAFDLDACVSNRLAPASPCAQQCLARLACPVGADYRYSDDAMRYFYRRSLDALRRYAAGRQ